MATDRQASLSHENTGQNYPELPSNWQTTWAVASTLDETSALVTLEKQLDERLL